MFAVPLWFLFASFLSVCRGGWGAGALLLLVWLALPKGFLLKVFALVTSGHSARAMSFSEEEVLGALRKIPSDGFLAESAEVQTKWLHFVASVDADPRICTM